MNGFARALALAATIAWPATGVAAPAASPSPAPCSASAYHQFDFWVGNWTVYGTQDRKLSGTNDVTREQGGCVLQEHWIGTSGDTGTSVNLYYDRAHHWHQTWVDNSGGLLLLDGGLRGGNMVLSGTMPGRDGKPVLNRIEWTPNKDGTVRQLWTASRNGGKTWNILFDGTYKKRA
jgi:hypothetical protein